MGRRSVGPVQLNGGDTWYVRLWVPRPLRQQVGKTTLIRSLKTTDHDVALRRYGAAYSDLEKELQSLLSPQTFRQKVELSAEDTSMKRFDDDQPLTPLEQTRLFVGDFNLDDPLHVHTFDDYNTGKELSLSWDEALEIWQEVRNREGPRRLSKSSISKVKCNVADFRSYCQPQDITFDILDEFVSDQEKRVQPTTVKSKLKGLSGILSALVSNHKLPRNILKDYSYKVGRSSERRPYTDEEFKIIAENVSSCLWLAMTGMRSGELENGVVEKNIMVVSAFDDDEFRPNKFSSSRRVPLPPGFERPTNSAKRWRVNLRKFIKDRNVTPLSGRHFFLQTSRRADCDEQIIAAICGHGSSLGSTTQSRYGEFTDDVLIREAQKVWNFVDSKILKNV